MIKSEDQTRSLEFIGGYTRDLLRLEHFFSDFPFIRHVYKNVVFESQ